MFGENKPKITLKKTKPQRYIEMATFACLFIALAYTIYNYTALPEQVPMHFNLYGEVDSYGDKNFVWLTHIIGFGLCFGIYKLNQRPHVFNYPIEITKDNAEKLYTSAVKAMSIVNFSIALLFAIISYQVVSLALSGGNEASTWSEYLIYFIIAVMTLGPLIWVANSSFRSET